MAAVGPTAAFHFLLRLGGKPPFGLSSGEFKESDADVGALDGEVPVGVLQVLGGGFQFLGGESASLLEKILDAAEQGGAAHEQRAGADTAVAFGAVGVALHDLQPLGGQSQLFGEDLQVGGGDALPHGLGAREEGEGAGACGLHGDGFVEFRSGPLDVATDAAPPQFPGLCRG